MARILAIDYGKKRVGIAVTDPLKLIANGLDTVPSNEIYKYLSEYFDREEVERVVVGYPVKLNNEPSEAVRYVNEFIRTFIRKFPGIPLEQHDERFTSRIAFQAMLDGGVKKNKRKDKAMVDKVSATILLQSYLEELANRTKFNR